MLKRLMLPIFLGWKKKKRKKKKNDEKINASYFFWAKKNLCRKYFFIDSVFYLERVKCYYFFKARLFKNFVEENF